MSVEPREDEYAKALARVDPRWDAAHTEKALAGLHRRRARRRAGAVLAGVLLVALGTALGTSRAGREDPAVAPSDAATGAVAPGSAPETSDRVVRLADGSRVVPDDGAQVIVEHVTDAVITVRVDRGSADVEVVRGLPRRFEVTIGAVTVTVLGTAFRVERIDDARVHVSVERGHVDVAWAAGHVDLFAGDEGTFPTSELATPVAVAADPDPVETVARSEARSAHEPREASLVTPRSGWRDLARASRYDEAYEALGGSADRATAVTDAVEDLLLAADVARLSGHPVEALPWLEAVERDHDRDPRAVLAAFTRGRILMEIRRPAEAARQLERVLAMEPGGSLAEDALARAALAHAAAGETASAHALAERYLAAYPSGRWVRRVRAIDASGAITP